MLDIFNRDIFGVVSLTDAINLLPYKPARIGQLGLFTPKPVRTTSVHIEERNGKLSLLQTSPRGTTGNTNSRRKRRVRTFGIPHIAVEDAVIADEVQGVRAFGAEDAVEAYTSVVNEKLTEMRQDHEVTHEYHRAGALRGEILDADGTLLFDLFDAFGITEKLFNFAVEFDGTADDDGSFLQLCTDVTRYIRDALGADTFDGIHALCGDVFFDKLVKHPEVRESYREWNQGAYYRTQKIGDGNVFEWGGIRWENYRGKVGDRDFVDADEARFFPTGVPGLFQTYYAPADYEETVNTSGREFYAKQERMKFDRGIELESQTNPLHICKRPAVLVQGRAT